MSDQEIELILKARQTEDISICLEPVNRWINHRVRVMISVPQMREDIVSECLIFFMEKIFPKLEIRALPPTSKYIARRMNMYIRFQYKKQQTRPIDKEEYAYGRDVATELDTTVESTDEVIQGGPTFTKVMQMLVKGKRQFEIANELGISRQRVWQIKEKMKRKWRRND